MTGTIKMEITRVKRQTRAIREAREQITYANNLLSPDAFDLMWSVQMNVCEVGGVQVGECGKYLMIQYPEGRQMIVEQETNLLYTREDADSFLITEEDADDNEDFQDFLYFMR